MCWKAKTLLCGQRSVWSRLSQGFSLPSGHTWLWELDHKEGRSPKKWCLWTVLLEKTPESPLDSKIKPVNLKGYQPWILLGKTDAETEAPVFWSSDVNIQLIGKDPDAGKDWGQEKEMTEDEMIGWYHWLNGRGFEQTQGDNEGHGILVCCSPWGHRESNTT